ncbi:putative UDP-glucuronosyl/UDP-glucosyltransferase, UDP-glycosyltransferase family [Helianthus annuus]|nr:putative UDP-glucuronosyl/UDP-glucosyltransferase, UDP-glycosyltransferase family [Helianthus annuus]
MPHYVEPTSITCEPNHPHPSIISSATSFLSSEPHHPKHTQMGMGSISEPNQQTSVLLVTVAAQGHVNPMLRLGNLLVSKGLHVTLATHDYALKHCSNTVGNIHLEFFSDGLPKNYNRNKPELFNEYMNSVIKHGPVNLSALIKSHTRKFSCIINTPFLPWAADVAADLGLPCAMAWIQPCTIYQIYYYYYNRLHEFPNESNPNMTVKLPGLPSFCSDELPSFVLPSNTFTTFDSILKEVFHNLHKIKWVLGNSFMELENDVITSVDKFWPVGPLVPESLFGKLDKLGGDLSGFDSFKSDKEGDCLEWLDKQEPASVVYISFGSLILSSEKQIESIACGLKRANRPFIWVVKLPENQETKQFKVLEDVKELGLVVKWCPQTAVLSHRSVGCFLSHCGWNSLVESIAAGVPVIACPKWSDQPTDAKLVTDVWKVGVKMEKDSEGCFVGEEVARCVDEIMSGPRSEEFRKNAAELKRASREAVADGGSSDKNIQLFVDELVSSSFL